LTFNFYSIYFASQYEAIHNKDYSVVKTFKPPRLPIRGIFFARTFHDGTDHRININRD